MLSNNDRLFIRGSLEKAKPLRLDGRGCFDFRRLKIQLLQVGQALVELGDTKVLATVSADIGAPYPDRTHEGNFFFQVDFSPVDPSVEPNRPNDQTIEIGRVIERFLKESKAIDSEALCIIAGEKVWYVRIDIVVLDHAGNLIDCASVAALSALKHFRRPSATIEANNHLLLHSSLSKEPIPLSIHHLPINTTFALFPQDLVIVDPSKIEEEISEGKITISVNNHREICGIQKSGGISISLATLMKCLRIATVKAQEVGDLIQKAKLGVISSSSSPSVSFVAVEDPKKNEKKKEDSVVDLNLNFQIKDKKEERNETRFSEYSQRVSQDFQDIQEENKLAKEFLLSYSENLTFGKASQPIDLDPLPALVEQKSIKETKKEDLKKKEDLTKKNQEDDDDDDDLSVALTKKSTLKKTPKKKTKKGK